MRPALLLLLVAAVAAEDATAAWARLRPVLEQALTPAGRAELAALPAAPLVEIAARVDTGAGTIAGTQRIWWPNPAAAELADVAVRAPANAPCFRGASVLVEEAHWNGTPLGEATANEDGTGLAWPLPGPWPAATIGALALRFTATPSLENGFHGLMRRAGDTWCLYHWHPELPLRTADGWRMLPVAGIGDESQGPLAHLVARLEVPAGLQVVAGGSIVARGTRADGSQQVVLAAPFCRNLAVVLAGAGFVADEVAALPGVTVRSWSDAARPNARRRAARVAAASLAEFHAAFGAYPFTELDVVEAQQGDDVGGMESTGLILIDGQAYEMCEYLPDDTPIEALPVLMLEEAVAHETAHQWWYGIVGNCAATEPWLDESLTNWAGGWALERQRGPTARNAALALCMVGVRMKQGGMTLAIDQPLAAFLDMDRYGAVVYGRGALMWEALRHRLGDEAFLAFVRDWSLRHRYGVATGDDWHAALAAALGAEEAAAFAARWLDADGLQVRDLMEALKPVREGPASDVRRPASQPDANDDPASRSGTRPRAEASGAPDGPHRTDTGRRTPDAGPSVP